MAGATAEYSEAELKQITLEPLKQSRKDSQPFHGENWFKRTPENFG
jgi:hypothetical protein